MAEKLHNHNKICRLCFCPFRALIGIWTNSPGCRYACPGYVLIGPSACLQRKHWSSEAAKRRIIGRRSYLLPTNNTRIAANLRQMYSKLAANLRQGKTNSSLALTKSLQKKCSLTYFFSLKKALKAHILPVWRCINIAPTSLWR